MPPENALSIALTCPLELENALQRELGYLGIPFQQMGRGVAELEASLETAYRLVLWSRVANRVLLPVQRVPLTDQESFYESMKALPWERWCEPDCSLAIQWTLASGEHHGQYFMYRLKDAICDHFKEQFDRRPTVDTSRPDIVFHLLLSAREACVYLDLGGGSLHRRGYRASEEQKFRAAAPLKENLAAALLYLADWHTGQASFLLDPLCGSGTFLIEAALMRLDRAPALLACGRRGALPCPGWLGHDPALWKKLVNEAEQRAHTAAQQQSGRFIFGLDGDKAAINQALHGAALAQVADWIHVERREVGQIMEWPRLPQLQEKGPWLLVTNPPYGARLGEAENMPYLYQHLGSVLQQAFPTARMALLSGSKQQSAAAGVSNHNLHYRQRVHNGPIGCDFTVSTIAAVATALTATQKDIGILQLDSARYEAALKLVESLSDKSLALSLLNRLRKNAKSLQKWIAQEKIECYRLYDADIPELNAAIDIYRDHLHIQEYAAPSSVDESKAEQRFLLLQNTLRSIFPDAAEIHCKVRRRQKAGHQYQRQDQRRSDFEVQEGHARLLVNLDDYIDSGLFLDHRPMRLYIGEHSKNQRFLNLFCYTGAASLHAAVNGAKSSVSVDLSPTYIQWAKRNLALNGLSESRHRFIQADVMRWLPLCREQFDLIFIDPPTFSNSKRSENDFDVQKDHVELIDMAMKRLEPGGQLIFSNNYRRFVLDQQLSVRYSVENVTEKSIPPDFRKAGKPIHQCWIFQRP